MIILVCVPNERDTRNWEIESEDGNKQFNKTYIYVTGILKFANTSTYGFICEPVQQFVFRTQEERSFERAKWTEWPVIEQVLRADFCLEESRFLVCLNLYDFFCSALQEGATRNCEIKSEDGNKHFKKTWINVTGILKFANTTTYWFICDSDQQYLLEAQEARSCKRENGRRAR